MSSNISINRLPAPPQMADRSRIKKAQKRSYSPPKESLELINNKSAMPLPKRQRKIEDLTASIHTSLLQTIDYIYTQATSSDQKETALAFLLHSQHYNADYTKEESLYLGYPLSLCAVQVKSGYIRTAHSQLMRLSRPWINARLLPFLIKIFPKDKRVVDNIRLCRGSAISTIETLFANSIQIQNIGALNPIKNKKIIVQISLTMDDLSKSVSEIFNTILGSSQSPINLNKVREEHPKLNFLFELKKVDRDCSLLWVATWDNACKDNTLKCVKLKGFFKQGDHSALNHAGAIPDRYALNKFLVEEIAKGSFTHELKTLGIASLRFPLLKKEKVEAKSEEWKAQLVTLKQRSFPQNPAIELYRQAILRWQECFYDPFSSEQLAVVAPLLCSQVIPWLSAKDDLIKWTKAYQNLCEITMFSLSYFPNLCANQNFEASLLQLLDPKNECSGMIKAAALFPYAMSVIFHIFQQLFARLEFKDKLVEVACISQNYFETLSLLKDIEKPGLITTQQRERLKDIEGFPSVVIADIHPNNAASGELAANDIGGWAETYFKKKGCKPLVLILDITLNYPADPEIQTLLQRLTPLIQTNKLEVIGIQSLAKLIQLGADNFSGGACFYFGKKGMFFPLTDPTKGAYFSLLNIYFKDLTQNYFLQIRGNTRWVYEQLHTRFKAISKTVLRFDTLPGFRGKTMFSAFKVTPNADENTVYIALSPEPLLKVIGKQRMNFMNTIVAMILKLAQDRNLPLTSRQSFGFTLSGINNAKTALRLSIGVESRKILQEYVDLLSDINYAFSAYVVEHPSNFDISKITKGLQEAYDVVKGEKVLTFSKVKLREKDWDESRSPLYKDLGDASLQLGGGKLLLQLPNGIAISQSEIKVVSFVGQFKYIPWTDRQLVRLAFHLTSLKHPYLSIIKEVEPKIHYGLSHIFEESYSFLKDEHSVQNEEIAGIQSKASIVFTPHFYLKLAAGVCFDSSSIYINTNDDKLPKKLNLLILENRDKAFTDLAVNHFIIKKKGENPKCLFLSFTQKKTAYNYEDEVEKRFETGDIENVVAFLNSLKDPNLPLTDSHRWDSFEDKSQHHLSTALYHLGRSLMSNLKENDIPIIESIQKQRWKIDLLNGIYSEVLNQSLSSHRLQPSLASNLDKLLFTTGFIPPAEKLSEWIESACEIHEKGTNFIESLASYLPLIFCLIKQEYETPETLLNTYYSVKLKEIANRTHFKSLNDHLATLELMLTGNINTSKYPSRFREYFRFYIDYPILKENCLKMLTHLKKTPEIERMVWIGSIPFEYEPIDKEYSDPLDEGETYCLFAHHQDAIKRFYYETGCLDILLNQLTNGEISFYIALRWGLITGITDIFSKMLEYLSEKTNLIENWTKVLEYKEFLDQSNVVEKKLYDRLLGMSLVSNKAEYKSVDD